MLIKVEDCKGLKLPRGSKFMVCPRQLDLCGNKLADYCHLLSLEEQYDIRNHIKARIPALPNAKYVYDTAPAHTQQWKIARMHMALPLGRLVTLYESYKGETFEWAHY